MMVFINPWPLAMLATSFALTACSECHPIVEYPLSSYETWHYEDGAGQGCPSPPRYSGFRQRISQPG
jgi:hypothetical protein